MIMDEPQEGHVPVDDAELVDMYLQSMAEAREEGYQEGYRTGAHAAGLAALLLGVLMGCGLTALFFAIF